MENDTKLAQELVKKADKILILAGAGMSVELGTPTYWSGAKNKYGEGKTDFGLTPLEHATEGTWDTHPQQQSEYFRKTYLLMQENHSAEYNHYKRLYEFLSGTNKDYFINTTNVDSAFIDNNFPEEKLFEIHGAYRYSQCIAQPVEHEVFYTTDPAQSIALCPICKGRARPNVMFFDDLHYNTSKQLLNRFLYDDFQEEMTPENSVILEIGAGASIPTLRNYSVRLNGRMDIPVIRMNPNKETGVDGIAKLIPHSKISPFIELPLTATDSIAFLSTST